MAIAMAVSFFLAFGGLTEKATHLSGDRPAKHLPRVAELLVAAENCGRFKTDMNHAIFAARVATAPILFPRSLLDEIFKRLVVSVGHQVAWAFPTAGVVRRHSPGGAHKLSLSAEIFHVDGRSDNVVALEKLACLTKLLADLLARHENFLGHHRSVRISR